MSHESSNDLRVALAKHGRDRVPFCRIVEEGKIILVLGNTTGIGGIDFRELILERIIDEFKILESQCLGKVEFLISLRINWITILFPSQSYFRLAIVNLSSDFS